MCASMIDLKKLMTRNMELEEELKSTCDGYEEEMTILVEMNANLTKKLGIFMRDPAPGGEDNDSTCPEKYIIIDDTTRTLTIAMMNMLIKLEQISWSLRPINFSSRPPYQ